MRLAQFVLFDGFDPLDIIAPYEILATAYEAELVSAEGPREVFSGTRRRAADRLRAPGHGVA